MSRCCQQDLFARLRCARCQGELQVQTNTVACADCGEQYGFFRGVPVLIRGDNELFPPAAYSDDETTEGSTGRNWNVTQRIKTWVPSRSVNLERRRTLQKISEEDSSGSRSVLVVGSGGQADQLRAHFAGTRTDFLFCDVDRNADVDVFCDAHELPFANERFDGVITTAVLEHVMYPEKVASEIARVTRPDGFVYSEIPFLQGVHEGAYDFTRFTMSGHRNLLRAFREEQSGVVAGPGTALVWSLVAFAQALFRSQRLSQLAGLLTRSCLFWLKYFDYLTQDNPTALDSASCTYFYGRKSDRLMSPEEIVGRYEGHIVQHV